MINIRKGSLFLTLAKRQTPLAQSVLCYSDYKDPSWVRAGSKLLKDRLCRIREKNKPKTPCYLRLRRSEFKCMAYQEIDRPDPCCPIRCPVPIDATKYCPTDKARRKYQRTWCEFRPSARLPRRIRRIFPKREFRCPPDPLCSACEPEECELPKSPRIPPPRLFEPKTMPMPCCKFCSVKCRSLRNTSKCYPPPTLPSCCRKKGPPYKSFSECKKYRLLPPIAACECVKKPSMCDLWNYYRTIR